jgi:hypothetical protein
MPPEGIAKPHVLHRTGPRDLMAQGVFMVQGRPGGYGRVALLTDNGGAGRARVLVGADCAKSQNGLSLALVVRKTLRTSFDGPSSGDEVLRPRFFENAVRLAFVGIRSKEW